MFDGLHVYLNWGAAVLFLGAFLLTFAGGIRAHTAAAVTWMLGALASYGVYIAPVFMQRPPGFEQRGTWIVPVACVVGVLSASSLLHRRVPRQFARIGGAIVFLALFPAIAILIWYPTFRMGMHLAPFGMETLGVGILWFRIREIGDGHQTA